jgi:cytoskeletal protein CcmA (bactofilin family)
MFGGNKANPTASSSGAVSHNSLVKGTIVRGNVKSEKDIRIDGTIEGSLTCDAKVVLGPTAYIKGTVTCRDAVVEGKLDGDIFVEDLLNMRKSANLNGEISTNKLIIEPGAVFKGNIKMGKLQNNGVKKPPVNISREAS